MVKIEDVIRYLEEIDEELEARYSNSNTIDHLYYCWKLSFWEIKPSEKTVYVQCDNHTKYSHDCYEEEHEFKTDDGWKVILFTRHSVDNLICAGYCGVANLFPDSS